MWVLTRVYQRKTSTLHTEIQVHAGNNYILGISLETVEWFSFDIDCMKIRMHKLLILQPKKLFCQIREHSKTVEMNLVGIK